jgi:hypothetical protein
VKLHELQAALGRLPDNTDVVFAYTSNEREHKLEVVELTYDWSVQTLTVKVDDR